MTVRKVAAARAENQLDPSLGERKNALLAPIPNTRAQQERTQQVVWEHATSRPDYVDLMCLLFQPPGPVRLKGTAPAPVPVPEPCGTEKAYRRHLAARDSPCADCRTAHAAHERRNWTRRQQEARDAA